MGVSIIEHSNATAQQQQPVASSETEQEQEVILLSKVTQSNYLIVAYYVRTEQKKAKDSDIYENGVLFNKKKHRPKEPNSLSHKPANPKSHNSDKKKKSKFLRHH